MGAYVLEHQLGEGGMGAVWMARHAMLGRHAAVKMLHPSLCHRGEVVTRFFNEARAASSIADPGIIQIFDFGHDDSGNAYIVMELLEGEALDRRLHRVGRLALPDALRVMRQVATSLGAAHQRGIVHRDLKPENIFLVHDPEVPTGERPKILDFGIAKLSLDTDSLVRTQTSAVMGTPTYMSPEQCRGAGLVDERSDVYALGCLLYTLLVGQPPFTAMGAGEILVMHLREPAPLASARAPWVPPAVDDVIARCLRKQPEERYATAAELAGVLETLGSKLSEPALSPLEAPARRRSYARVVAAIACVVIAGVSAFLVAGNRGAPASRVVERSDPPPPPPPEPPPPEPVVGPEVLAPIISAATRAHDAIQSLASTATRWSWPRVPVALPPPPRRESIPVPPAPPPAPALDLDADGMPRHR